jgi:hypothetical protein
VSPPSAPTAPSTAVSVSFPTGMAMVREVLAKIYLEQYAAVFDDLGYDDLNYLVSLPRERRLEIGASMGMKEGHAAKFADWIAQASVS